MRIDLIAPNAMIQALDESNASELGINRMIDSGVAVAPLAPLPQEPQLMVAPPPQEPAPLPQRDQAAGEEAGEQEAGARGAFEEKQSKASVVSAEALAESQEIAQALLNDETQQNVAFDFSGAQNLLASLRGGSLIARGPQTVEMRYASMAGAAMGAARRAMLSTIGQLDITLMHEATGLPMEASGMAAQAALNLFSGQEEDSQEWSEESFAQELSARGFPKSIAQSHAQTVNALMKDEERLPPDLLASLEIKLDSETSRMESAALYLRRPGSNKMATADIRWANKDGAVVPLSNISVGYVH